MEDIHRDVEVGGKLYRVGRFRGRKATAILREAAAIGRRFPKLSKIAAAFEEQYVSDNKLTFTRTEAEYQLGASAKNISEEAWQQAGELSIKRMPDPRTRLLVIFPELFEAAEGQVIRLLALISATNEELAEAAVADGSEEFLKGRGNLLMDQGDMEELVELALAGAEVARGQFAPLVERITELTNQIGLQTSGAPKTEPTGSSGPSEPETKPSSSTDSPMPTDGTSEPSSTAPVGETSEPALTG